MIDFFLGLRLAGLVFVVESSRMLIVVDETSCRESHGLQQINSATRLQFRGLSCGTGRGGDCDLMYLIFLFIPRLAAIRFTAKKPTCRCLMCFV